MLTLKRFGGAYGSKINGKVEFPVEEELNLSPWLASDDEDEHSSVNTTSGKSTSYMLTAMVRHTGAAYGGHYLSYARNHLDGGWYCYDDSQVYPIEPSEVCYRCTSNKHRLSSGWCYLTPDFCPFHVFKVADLQAYVLFYQRISSSCPPIDVSTKPIRKSSSMAWISRKWYSMYLSAVEPGSVDNHESVVFRCLSFFSLLLSNCHLFSCRG